MICISSKSYKKSVQERLIIFIQVIILSTSFNAAAQTSENINIAGTGSFMGSILLLADKFNYSQSEVYAKVLPNMGSGGSIRGLIGGGIDLAIISRELRDDEIRLNLFAKSFACTPVVLVTHSSNNISGVTFEELVDIYQGKTSYWPNGDRIRIILRPPDDDHSVLLKNFFPEMRQAVNIAERVNGAIIADSDEENSDALENIPGSLGLNTLATVLSEQRALIIISLNGITPSIENLQNNSYPYYEQYYLVTRREPGEAVKKFIDYLYSREGVHYLSINGSLIDTQK